MLSSKFRIYLAYFAPEPQAFDAVTPHFNAADRISFPAKPGSRRFILPFHRVKNIMGTYYVDPIDVDNLRRAA